MQTSPKGVHVGLAARRLRPSLTSGLTVRSEGKEGTGREPSRHLAEQPSRAGSGTFCSFCCAPQRDLSLQTEGGSSLKEPSTFVPLLDAEARDLNLGDLRGGGTPQGERTKETAILKVRGLGWRRVHVFILPWQGGFGELPLLLSLL